MSEKNNLDNKYTAVNMGPADSVKNKQRLKKRVGIGLGTIVIGAVGGRLVLQELQGISDRNIAEQGIAGATKSPEEAIENHVNSLMKDYAQYGRRNMPPATNEGHHSNQTVAYLSAESGGPNWHFAWAVDESGNFTPGILSEPALNSIIYNYGLKGKQDEIQYLRDNWSVLRNNPETALGWFKAHDALPVNIEYYKNVIDVSQSDSTQDTWIDRLQPIFDWRPTPTATPESREIEIEGEKGIFSWVEPIETIAERIGIEPGEVLGPAATLRAEWQHGQTTETDRQFQAVEMAGQIMAYEKRQSII